MNATAAANARTARLAAEWRWLAARRDLRAQVAASPRERARAAAAVANALAELRRAAAVCWPGVAVNAI